MEHKDFFAHLLCTFGIIITINVNGAPNSEVQEPLYTIKDKNQFPSLNIQIEGHTFDDLLSAVKDWSLTHGTCYRSRKHYSPDLVGFESFTIFPSPFPRSEYEKAMKIQPAMSLLYHKIAHDHEFLRNSLENTIKVDEFTKKLFDIYETVRKEGSAQEYSLGLFRSDYLLESGDGNLNIKQVEMNTISVGGQGCANLHLLHKYALRRLKLHSEVDKVPENKALHEFSAAVIKAWEHYNNPKAIVLMIVEEGETNICDQRNCEFQIFTDNPEISVLRRTFDEIAARGRFNEKKEFFVDDMEVAVAYYRTGYMPKHYTAEKHWQVRLDIERSKAIKCPTVGLQLAGTKKVQQALALQNAVSRFLPDDDAKAINEVFTGLYSLDLNPEGDKAVEMALKNPELYVLKPQREGGGNNFYGEDIPKVLLPIKNSKERSAYILMRRIMPPITQNYIVVAEVDVKPVKQDVVSELGIFGEILGSKDKIELNTYRAGSYMRTKSCLSNETGVCAGLGGSNDVYLF